MGAVENVRFLLDKVQSPYFMWLGGHDFINNRFVEICVGALEIAPHCALASGRIRWQKEQAGPYIDCNEALNTFHMPPRVALLAWLWSFFSCFQFYGVYRTEIIRKVGVPSFYSPDVAMIASVLLHGSAIFCGDAVYYATRNRPGENTKEQIRRYASLGLSSADLDYLDRSDARMKRFYYPCRDYILKAVWKTDWPWIQKFWTSVEVRRVFKERFDYIICS
jgi:hypothetical protein